MSLSGNRYKEKFSLDQFLCQNRKVRFSFVGLAVLASLVVGSSAAIGDGSIVPAAPQPTSTTSSTLTVSPATPALSTPIQPYQFPALVDTPVPDELTDLLESAPTDLPKPYKDRCHVQQNLTATAASCLYGNLTSNKTIVLFGDSHALSWFPAFEKLATLKKWRLLSLTMSSCWPASIPAWNSTTQMLMNNCAIWRKGALKKIAQVQPYITFVTGTRGFSTVNDTGTVLTGDARTAAWQTGMKTTLTLIKRASQNTFLISDAPESTAQYPDCLEGSLGSVLACATPTSKAIDVGWLTTERNLAAALNVYWINPTTWICNTEPCSPIGNDAIIYRDGGHLTSAFAATLERPLWSAVSKLLAH